MSDLGSSQKQQPLSPHLQIYKPQMTSMLSILHRMTGAANALGLLLFSVWILCLAHDEASYVAFTKFMATPIGQLLLIGWSGSVYYHLCNGIRHLIWDTGRLFKIQDATRAGYAVLLMALCLTAGTWACIYIFHPGVTS